MKTQKIIKKWYSLLSFPEKYNAEFEELLYNYRISENVSIDGYEFSNLPKNGELNLLICLYFCEELQKSYNEKNIPNKILIETLSDLVYWTGIHYSLYKKLGVSEMEWLKNHFSMKLFRIGRLQYCPCHCYNCIDDIGVIKGDTVIEVHIPANDDFDTELCQKSIQEARKFFSKYYPEINYKCFTCSSWLLDDTLESFLKETSNIIKFQRMFTMVSREESDAILKYTFAWDARRDNINTLTPYNSFTEKILKHIIEGGKFYAGYGYIGKQSKML